MTNPDELILLSHGGGGQRTRRLIRDLILRHLNNPLLAPLDDSACLTIPESELAFTTDSYVITPLFFPGGDIGTLAACGTLNDLAMQGAEPRYLSLGLILEEGLPVADLDRILSSLAAVTREAGVPVVTGDTKVVERGKGNGIFINTSGLGVRRPGVDAGIANARPGDALLITGTMGDHGAAVLAQREGLELRSALRSDVAALWPLIRPLLDAMPAGIHGLRDPTRGGVAAAVCDIAEAADVGIRLREADLPVRSEVRGLCQLLGLEPLQVANEGKALVVCAADDADRALAVLRAHPLGRAAARIGTVTDAPRGRVLMETLAGGERLVEPPLGEELPRIC